MITHFLTELLGTMILIIIGNGIVANTVLKGTKGENAGWLAIAIGWGFAVVVAATISSALGGKSHLNPAITLAYVVNDWKANVGSWGLLPIFLIGQILGAMLGQIILDIIYMKHIHVSHIENRGDLVLAMHSTVPTHKNIYLNLFTEFLATSILVGAILSTSNGWFKESHFLGTLFVGIVVIGIGLGIGGTTGYAINPARDLGPRIIHQIAPFDKNYKIKSDWSYGWIPIVAPSLSGLFVGLIFLLT
ncbi:glycerol uptake facilitator protein [Spiroplasma sabaudiense Ar-1343]|uniref:Glycerol uptake facilitator protein n=1 Tax=Spiroplasma sabaudiense Ar-1343 TaxID=1276257 RepID=W6AAJ5_9MOLU|nr:MIP/aquaporin family protein [Spiroplasma sabaudiense]AHI54082.1 glycerol uptake facilitator protein [Spiroplasma sabaudiense Ar-1343]